MGRFFTIPSLFLLVAFRLFASPGERGVIHFHSDYEKEAFYTYSQDPTSDILHLFLAVNPDNDQETYQEIRKVIDQQISKLERRGLIEKSPVKALRMIFASLHRRQLIRFNPGAEFSDIFTKGTYNCVTATALIATIFEEFGIDYTIRLAPTHVFLIARTPDGRVFMETTDPVNGFIRENRNLEYRLKKYIPLDPNDAFTGVQNNNGDAVSPFFDETLDISLAQLAGVQYYNVGVTAFTKKDYKTALHLFDKAQSFLENDRHTQAIRICLMNLINNYDFTKATHMEKLLRLCNLASEDYVFGNIIHGVKQLSQFHLFTNSDENSFRDAYFHLYQNSENPSLRVLLQGFYLMEMGKYYIHTEDYKNSVKLLVKAHETLPHIFQIENLLDKAISLNQHQN